MIRADDLAWLKSDREWESLDGNLSVFWEIFERFDRLSGMIVPRIF